MNNKPLFDWYKFYRHGYALSKHESDEYLRTAINRFYYGSFCYARDYLISKQIFHNKELKNEMLSNTSNVHKATREIFKKEKHRINPKKGMKVHKYLHSLRKNRNKVDYDSNTDFDLEHLAKQSETYSKKIFEIIEK